MRTPNKDIYSRKVIYSRLLTPVYGELVRIGVSADRNGVICYAFILPNQKRVEGRDCKSKKVLSARGWSQESTFHVGVHMAGTLGNQYSLEAGLVDDHVRRMTLLRSSGKQIPVPIKDNTYVYEVARTDFPLRLVAFDSANRVVGVETYVANWAGMGYW